MVIVSTGNDENGKENRDWTTPKSARGSSRKGVCSDEEDGEFGFVEY